MTCYHPLKAFKIGFNNITNKNIYKITSYNTDYIFKSKDEEFYHTAIGDPFYRPFTEVITDSIDIPCGQCIGCRLAYSRDWANRCMLEAKNYENNYFVTFTYDDIHVPIHNWSDDETGEVGKVYSLEKRDFQLFMKRLRKHFSSDKIRFFSCGEYGTQTMRPHYHAILFNLNLTDLKLYKKSMHGFNYYNSPILSKLWNKGHVIVADVSWESCAYVARYVMKKAKGKTADFYNKYNMQSEFVLMSRRPGIARDYYEANKYKIYDTDELIFTTSNGGKKSRPPKYFDRIFSEECPELFEDIKNNRTEMSEKLKELKLKNTDLSYPELLMIEEDNKEKQISTLHRDL